MASETVAYRIPDGATRPATADIERYSTAARSGRAAAWIVGGLFVGGMCLVAPGPHILVTTWALPLAGVFMGLRAFKTPVRLYEVQGRCPSCDEVVEFLGGRPPDARVCPHCKTPIELVIDGGGGSAVTTGESARS